MDLFYFLNEASGWGEDTAKVEVSFVGIKWQDELHPSAEEFPIEFVSCSSAGKNCIKIKFVTKPHKS